MRQPSSEPQHTRQDGTLQPPGIDFALAYDTLIAAYLQCKGKMHPQTAVADAKKECHE